MIEVGIVGGGPAGAYCAYKLAENGIYPTIFDHSHPREKPCGGLISPLAQELFPFLRKLPIDPIKRRVIYLVSPYGRRISVNLKKSEAICVSRLKFDQYLLTMALDKGAELKREKVVDVQRKGKLWNIITAKSIYPVKKLVGADGVNSIVKKKVTTPFRNADKGVCCGYYVENLENEDISFHFLPHRKGYIWIIPRKDNTCVGIGCSEATHSKNLRKELDLFIKRNRPNTKIISKWAALIPNVKETGTLFSHVAGPNWVLIGDAAGHVNPINGEGIPYALLGGELAAQAIAENDMMLFEKLWRRAYGLNLLLGVKLRKWMYKRHILEVYCIYIKIRSAISGWMWAI
ncbi:MAG: NAD(P)/FAD-dependent oxidoreductase [Candidatus Bathyarchaeia archaeon]